MGIDLELFVHPERISSQLICPICTQVLENPVQTSSEHLFCEDELLEWLSRSSLCPITKIELDPSTIRKPGRIILNMLSELEMYCKNRAHGCAWTGSKDHLFNHLATCKYQSQEYFQNEILERDNKIIQLEHVIDELAAKNEDLRQENICLIEKIEEYQRRIRVFHALLPQNTISCSQNVVGMINDESDVRSFADSLSILLMDDDEALVEEGDTHKVLDDGKFEDSDGIGVLRIKSLSDADRLRRLRSLSLTPQELRNSHK